MKNRPFERLVQPKALRDSSIKTEQVMQKVCSQINGLKVIIRLVKRESYILEGSITLKPPLNTIK